MCQASQHVHSHVHSVYTTEFHLFTNSQHAPPKSTYVLQEHLSVASQLRHNLGFLGICVTPGSSRQSTHESGFNTIGKIIKSTLNPTKSIAILCVRQTRKAVTKNTAVDIFIARLLKHCLRSTRYRLTAHCQPRSQVRGTQRQLTSRP